MTGAFASGADPGQAIALDGHQQALKSRMLRPCRSQQRTLALFGVETERFRMAPTYRFNAPAHDSGVYYDRFDWGLYSDRWVNLAADALENLRLRSC